MNLQTPIPKMGWGSEGAGHRGKAAETVSERPCHLRKGLLSQPKSESWPSLGATQPCVTCSCSRQIDGLHMDDPNIPILGKVSR